jgi:hypothetical protein
MRLVLPQWVPGFNIASYGDEKEVEVVLEEGLLIFKMRN